jgi:hypothetical protein
VDELDIIAAPKAQDEDGLGRCTVADVKVPERLRAAKNLHPLDRTAP